MAENFISGSIKDIQSGEEDFGNILKIGNENDINEGNYITIFMKNDKYEEEKFHIIKKDGDTITLNEEIMKNFREKGFLASC